MEVAKFSFPEARENVLLEPVKLAIFSRSRGGVSNKHFWPNKNLSAFNQ